MTFSLPSSLLLLKLPNNLTRRGCRTDSIWAPFASCKPISSFLLFLFFSKGVFLLDDPDQDQLNDPRSLWSWRIKETEKFTLGMDSFDAQWSEWSWITDPDLDHAKGTHPKLILCNVKCPDISECQMLKAVSIVWTQACQVSIIISFNMHMTFQRKPLRLEIP